MKASKFPFLQKHLFFWVHLKGLLTGSFGKKYYGQWGEDIALGRLFADTPRGFFVDVGAYHPMHYSNTYLLYKRGWRGINIDANPASIRLFDWHRKRDINLNLGVGEREEEKTYYIFNHQSCNTFSPEQRDFMLQKKYLRPIGERKVHILPLQKILDKHAHGRAIALLNIDVEGMGLEVLRSLDWGKSRPWVIAVEDDEFDFAKMEKSRIYPFLSAQSYLLHSKVGPTCIYKLER